MHFIKLDVNFYYDERLVHLGERCGLSGQMRLLKVWCIIAKQIKNEKSNSWVSYSPLFWVSELNFRSIKDCRTFLKTLDEIGLIKFDPNPQRSLFGNPQAGDNLGITSYRGQSIRDRSGIEWLLRCDKLLKIRDRRGQIQSKSKNIYSARAEGEGTNPENSEDDWKNEWRKIRDHVRRRGTHVAVEGLTEKGRQALSKIGGLSYVGQTETSQMKFLGYEFRDAWREK